MAYLRKGDKIRGFNGAIPAGCRQDGDASHRSVFSGRKPKRDLHACRRLSSAGHRLGIRRLAATRITPRKLTTIGSESGWHETNIIVCGTKA